MCVIAYYGGQENLQELILSFHQVKLRVKQVVRPGSTCPYLLNYLNKLI